MSKAHGISARESRYMVEFARTYKNLPTSADLNWSQYRDLLAGNDAEKKKVIGAALEQKQKRKTEALLWVPG